MTQPNKLFRSDYQTDRNFCISVMYRRLHIQQVEIAKIFDLTKQRVSKIIKDYTNG